MQVLHTNGPHCSQLPRHARQPRRHLRHTLHTTVTHSQQCSSTVSAHVVLARPFACCCAHNGSEGNAPSTSASQHSDAESAMQAQYERLALMPLPQLRNAAATNPEATSSPFLFYLRDLEQRARKTEAASVRKSPQQSQQQQQSEKQPEQQQQFIASGSASAAVWLPSQGESSSSKADAVTTDRATEDPQDLFTADKIAQVAAELVAARERQELEASSRLLPSLASSLAYDNLIRWRREQQSDQASVQGKGDLTVGGVSVEELYRAGEKQEQKLAEEQQRLARLSQQQSPSRAFGGGLLNQQGSSSCLSSEEGSDPGDFAARPGNEAFKEMAALAMARMRSRFVGFEDDSATAAASVLETLLSTGKEWGRGGWADQMHQAFYPPGIVASRASADMTANDKEAQPEQQLVCTTPEDLRSEVTSRLEGGDASDAQQLSDLLEDLEDYITHVWTNRTRNPLDRFL